MSRSFAESDTTIELPADLLWEIGRMSPLDRRERRVRVSCAAAPERPTFAQRRAFPAHKRFVQTAKKVEGSDEAEDFELSFSQMVSSTKLTKTPVSRK
jgi:hypothetical protein